MMQCVQQGHVIVALANLKPRDGGMWEPWDTLFVVSSSPLAWAGGLPYEMEPGCSSEKLK